MLEKTEGLLKNWQHG